MNEFANFSITGIDAIEYLKTIKDGSIDMIVTDPPYESLEKHRKIGTTTRLKHSKSSSNDWFLIFPNSKFEELFNHFYRVLKNNSHFYMFCDSETAFVVKPIGENAGFKFWKPIIWDKVNIGMGYHYRARYEFILFFEKGKRKLNNLGIADVISSKRIHNGYPAEKPVEVNEILVLQSTIPGEIIMDPFMGSGSVGVAALKNGRRFLGNDICEEACNISKGRFLSLSGEGDNNER